MRGRRVAVAVLGLLGAWSAWAGDPASIASTVCAACHGSDGNSVVPVFPKLAGQHAEYLRKQLNDFISGKRENDLMAPIVANLSRDDVTGLAAYFAAQKAAPGKSEDAELASVGKKLYEDGNTSSGVPACTGCHQPQGAGNERYPRLAGQHQAYVLNELTIFKNGGRSNDKGKVMRSVAERLTEAEMKAVAEYLAGQ